jgi:glucokinase
MTSDVNSCVLVYDIGGSHISAAVCHSGDFHLGQVIRAGLPERQTSEAFVEVLFSLGRQASAEEKNVIGAGLGMPGPFDYVQGISWMQHKLQYLYGVNLCDAIASRFSWNPAQVRFLNDAAAYLWGEVGAGAAHDVPRAVGITLGTGVGSAFAQNGRVVTDGPGVPPGGEIWNISYEGGIVEDLISTRALQKRYRERTGKEREVASIAHYASGGEPVSAQVFGEFGTYLGQVIRHLMTEFAPDVVVLGGGISRSAHLFLPAAANELKGTNIRLRVSALGDDAALVGAGVAWFARSAS